jgi:diguanylate cyclase (GGDEF)-like protein
VLVSDTDEAGVLRTAEKLRQSIEEIEFKDIGKGKLTASFGVAFFERGDTEESFISRADSALYKAKEKGRNLVEIYKQS